MLNRGFRKTESESTIVERTDGKSTRSRDSVAKIQRLIIKILLVTLENVKWRFRSASMCKFRSASMCKFENSIPHQTENEARLAQFWLVPNSQNPLIRWIVPMFIFYRGYTTASLYTEFSNIEILPHFGAVI